MVRGDEQCDAGLCRGGGDDCGGMLFRCSGAVVVFPRAGQLVSPDGRFVVRNVDREGAASEFAVRAWERGQFTDCGTAG